MIADLWSFLQGCAASGTLIASICGLILVPFLTWLGAHALAPYIVRMRDDVAWQAPLAAIAAIIPGAVFATLATIGLLGASSSGCLNFVWGRLLVGVIVTLAFLAIGRATLKAYRNAVQVRRLIDVSRSPDSAIETIACRCGVKVRVLSYQEPFCALAGIWNPVVLISRGTLERLDDEELEAALRHERAHAIRFDLLLGAVLSFCADLLPLPASDLIETYAMARESAADEHAVRTCAPDALASAILSLAMTQTVPHGAAALAEDIRSIKNRVMRLADNNAASVDPRRRRIIATGLLATLLLLSFAPAVLSAFNYYTCTVKGMHG